jgi:hypothetical protein
MSASPVLKVRCLARPFAILLASISTASVAWSQSTPQPEQPQQKASSADNATTLPTMTVETAAPKKPRPKPGSTANKSSEQGTSAPTMASANDGVSAPVTGAPNTGAGPVVAPNLVSQLTIPGDELNLRPVTRPGEILEAVPGLIVTQHSGEGKANQYFLRGYNLDHGTDMAIFVDDVPINMRTHAHGQGYSDLNWLMPETVNAVDVRKGPYFANEGDFGSAGNLHIGLIDKVDRSIASVTIGSFGYARLFAMSSAKAGDGNLLVATEVATYDGPWSNPDDVRKLNIMMRYSQGSALDGFTITGMAYSNQWNSTDQVPERAITTGQISRYGEEDPTDGGNTSRFALAARLARPDDAGSWKVNAYVLQSSLDLFNNFTYFLTNSTQGDQFHQHDERIVAGANVARSLKGSLEGMPTTTTVGIQTRYDAINLGLTDTYQRAFRSNIRSDKVDEGSVGIFVENTVHWSQWLRTTLGWRGDLYAATVDSIYDANNSGRAQASLGSPKFSLVLGPFNKSEFFFGAGTGMHSNDARGATITESPTDPTTKLSASPLLVLTEGAEIGVRSKAIADLDTSISVFVLNQASEIIFNGDGGDTSPSRPSQRYGIEWTNKYRPNSWLTFDGDLALSHARFLGYDTVHSQAFASLTGYPQAHIGNAPGNYTNAPAVVASVGLMFEDKTGWFGGPR